MISRVFSSLVILWIVSNMAFPYSTLAGEGEVLFQSLHCGSCHKPEEKAEGTPLVQIAQTYGNKEKLLKYFQGEAEPLIQWGKPAMMKGQLKKIQALSDEQKTALADYILGFVKQATPTAKP